MNKYGTKESWAVVTGGSDGIGLEMLKKLAGEGFNVCMIARNENKMEEKCRELEKENKVKTMYIVADFAKMETIEEYQKVADQLKGLDVAIMVLNAGWGRFAPYVELTDDEVQDIVRINAVHVAYMAKVMIQ